VRANSTVLMGAFAAVVCANSEKSSDAGTRVPSQGGPCFSVAVTQPSRRAHDSTMPLIFQPRRGITAPPARLPPRALSVGVARTAGASAPRLNDAPFTRCCGRASRTMGSAHCLAHEAISLPPRGSVSRRSTGRRGRIASRNY
jgi:hypothetical protein